MVLRQDAFQSHLGNLVKGLRGQVSGLGGWVLASEIVYCVQVTVMGSPVRTPCQIQVQEHEYSFQAAETELRAVSS